MLRRLSVAVPERARTPLTRLRTSVNSTSPKRVAAARKPTKSEVSIAVTSTAMLISSAGKLGRLLEFSHKRQAAGYGSTPLWVDGIMAIGGGPGAFDLLDLKGKPWLSVIVARTGQ